MNDFSDLPTTIDPDEMPGGLVMVTYADGEEQIVQRVHPSDPGAHDAAAEYSASMCVLWRDQGQVAVLQCFDGDSGERIMSVDARWPDCPHLWVRPVG